MPSEHERARHIAAGVKHGVSNKLRHIWWTFLMRGLLALILAACALFWPQKTMGIMIKLLGGYFIIDGLAGAVAAFRTGGKSSFPVQAIVSLAAGLALLFWTGISAKLFLIVVGVWALLQGVGIFMSSRDLDPGDEDRRMMGIIGMLVAVVGLVFVFWPKTGLVAISWLIAAGAAVVGGLLVYLATRLKRVRTRVEEIGT